MTLTILQIIPNLGAGGAEQACVDVAAALAARGGRALVMSAGGRRVAEVERVGGEHFLWPVSSKNPFVMLRNARRLARFIHAERVDIVHARSRAPAWSAWLACRMTGCRFVTTFHAAYKFSGAVKKFYNRVMTRADRIIAISDYIAAHVQDSYGVDPQKIRVVPRGIALEKFTPEAVTEARRTALRQAWKIQDNVPLILLPARLSPIKGQSVLIEAMALLPRACAVQAVIVGDDQGRKAYRQILESLIAARGLEKRVFLVQHCADMPAALSLAAMVAVPSKVPEGFGRVPVEAMAMGKPVLASDLGATRETVVEGETGWLLSPEKPEDWAQAIQKVLALSPPQRASLARTAQERARTLFDTRRMVAATLAVYDELKDEAAHA